VAADFPFEFETGSLPVWRRVQLTAWRECFHWYGLWRASVLQAMTIRECTHSPDMQMMMSANCRGAFVRNDHAVFKSYLILKTPEQQAMYHSYAKLPVFFR